MARIFLRRLSQGTAFLACLVVSLWADLGSSQESAAPAPDPQAVQQDTLEGLRFFPYVIVVDDDEAMSSPDASSVIIPRASLEAWIREKVAEKLGIEKSASVSSVQLDLTLQDRSAHLKASMTIRSDAEGDSWVNVGMANAHLTAATLQLTSPMGESSAPPTAIPADLRSSMEGYRLRIPTTGTYQLLIEAMIEIEQSAAAAAIDLSLPSAPVKRVQLVSSVPLEALRQNNADAIATAAAEGKSWQIALKPDDPLALRWTLPADDAALGQFIATNSMTHVRIEESEIVTESTMRLYAGQPAKTARFRIGVGDRVLQLELMRENQPIHYELEQPQDASSSVLTLHIPQPISGEISLRLKTRRLRDDKVAQSSLFPVTLAGDADASGVLLLSWSSGLWVRAAELHACQRLPANNLPSIPNSWVPRLAFRFAGATSAVDVVMEKARPIFDIKSAIELRVGDAAATLSTRFDVRIQGAPAESVVVVAPSRLDQIRVGPVGTVRLRESRPIEEGLQELVLDFSEPYEDRDAVITIEARMAVVDGLVVFAPPAIRFDGETEGSLLILAEPGVSLRLNERQTEYLQRQPLREVDRKRPGAQWLFEVQSPSARLVFDKQVVSAEAQVRVESVISRRQAHADVASTFSWSSSTTPLETVFIHVPEGVSNLQISGEGLAEAPTEVKGTTPLELRNPAQDFQLVCHYQVDLPNGAFAAHIPLVAPRSAELSSWRGRILCDRGTLATLRSPWSTTPADTEVLAANGLRPVLHFQWLEGQEVPDVLSVAFEPAASLVTFLIPKVLIEESLTSSGDRWGRKRWLVAKHRTNDARLVVPAPARLKEVFVDGQSIAAIPTPERTLKVPLPQTNAPCTLEVTYTFPQGRGDGAFSTRELVTPTLLEDVAIEDVRWIVHVADDRLLVRSDGRGESQNYWSFPGFLRPGAQVSLPSDSREWLDHSIAGVTWASHEEASPLGHYWQFDSFGQDRNLHLITLREPFWILLCSGASLVLILAISRLKWINQLRAIVVLVLVGLALFASAPELLLWLWLGAQWGVMVGLAAIVVQWWILHRRRRAYGLGLRRMNAKPLSLGAALFSRLEPKTRISTSVSRPLE